MYIYGGLFLTLLCIVAAVCANPLARNQDQLCTMGNRTFSVGESVTGDACDECYCTVHGLMCALKACPVLSCEHKVMGQCCYECYQPPEPQICVYEGQLGRALVPPTGCRYSGDKVCFCYHDSYSESQQPEVFCLPPFPMDMTEPCTLLPQ